MPSRLVWSHDVDLADDPLRLRPGQIDRQKAIGQIGAQNLHAVDKEKRALKLTGGDAAMQEVSRLVIGLSATNNELIFFEGHFQLIPGEARDSQSDAKTLRIVLRASQALDIIRWISIPRSLCDTIERLLDLIEA
jgi:hypothetical protein